MSVFLLYLRVINIMDFQVRNEKVSSASITQMTAIHSK